MDTDPSLCRRCFSCVIWDFSFLAELHEDFKRYEDATDKYHEAGFDAYVTGCMFASLTNYLGNSTLCHLCVSYLLFCLSVLFVLSLSALVLFV